jgi:hypothetical protein
VKSTLPRYHPASRQKAGGSVGYSLQPLTNSIDKDRLGFVNIRVYDNE